MTVALILLTALLVVGALLFVLDRSGKKKSTETEAGDTATEAGKTGDNSECCGMHITCERDSLLAGVSERIEYYDDEELDRFAGRMPESYDRAETEEFRDVLLSMLPSDIAGWARSLQLRGIQLPEDVRDELLLIVSEARASALSH